MNRRPNKYLKSQLIAPAYCYDSARVQNPDPLTPIWGNKQADLRRRMTGCNRHKAMNHDVGSAIAALETKLTNVTP